MIFFFLKKPLSIEIQISFNAKINTKIIAKEIFYNDQLHNSLAYTMIAKLHFLHLIKLLHSSQNEEIPIMKAQEYFQSWYILAYISVFVTELNTGLEMYLSDDGQCSSLSNYD